MNYLILHFALACLFVSVLPAQCQEVANSEDWSEKPEIITVAANIPSDAIILFDSETQSLENWQTADGKMPEWKVEDGVLEIVPGTGDIFTKQHFGDCQLHVEWMIPEANYGHGNSGIYLQGLYEVQIFNSHENTSEIYYNGQTGSLYKQHSPLVNVSQPRGSWDTFDIIFTAPRFDKNGQLLSPARFTVLHNGVVIQLDAVLKGITTHEPFTSYQAHALKQPLMLQDHGDRVLFRNIWIREL